MIENLMKVIYLILGFIYAVALYSFLPALLAFFDQTQYFTDTNTNFPTQKLIYCALHIAIAAFIVSLIDKVLTLLQWEEENTIVGLIMESLSFSVPAMFRGLMWAVALLVANFIAMYAADINVLANALDSWPFPL